jgi:hypothetical protein
MCGMWTKHCIEVGLHKLHASDPDPELEKFTSVESWFQDFAFTHAACAATPRGI